VREGGRRRGRKGGLVCTHKIIYGRAAIALVLFWLEAPCWGREGGREGKGRERRKTSGRESKKRRWRRDRGVKMSKKSGNFTSLLAIYPYLYITRSPPTTVGAITTPGWDGQVGGDKKRPRRRKNHRRKRGGAVQRAFSERRLTGPLPSRRCRACGERQEQVVASPWSCLPKAVGGSSSKRERGGGR